MKVIPPELEVESVRAPSTSRSRSSESASASCRGRGRFRDLPLRGAPYYATRILLQNGFNAPNISGGVLARSHGADA